MFLPKYLPSLDLGSFPNTCEQNAETLPHLALQLKGELILSYF